ncbi:MAG: cation diffusion facilitator family transporter [Candidatus Aminicenantaceae bacterium]
MLLTNDERQKKIRSITLWGVLVNVFLMFLKIIVGIWIKSSALIADGVHSFSDLATDFIVLMGTKLSYRPPDESHPYGHSKIETVACLLVAIILLGAGMGLIWSAATSIYHHRENFPGSFMLIVAVVSVIAKETLFFLTRKIARITQSSALYANAWHHRSDAFSSLAVLMGGLASLFGWGYADHAATIIVGFMIAAVAGKILYDNLIELSEHSADRESIRVIENVLSEEKDVFHWHALRTRKHGVELFVDAHVLVDPSLSVLDSHKISMKIEEKIKKRLSRPVNALIHIEPHIKKMHK